MVLLVVTENLGTRLATYVFISSVVIEEDFEAEKI